MKNKIWCLIVLCLVVAIIAGYIFWHNTSNDDPVADVSKQVFSSLITGLVSFTGLLITITFQNQQALHKQLVDIQPCFVVIPDGAASAEKTRDYFQSNGQYYLCSSSTYLRTISSQIKNVKSNAYAINVALTDDLQKIHYPLGSYENEPITCDLALKNGTSLFYIDFEDVYGTKYYQEIKYEYNNEHNQYTFIMSQPTRK